MKIITFIITFALCIWGCITIDGIIVEAIVNAFPKSVDEWKGIISICSWILILILTGGLAIWISILISGLVTFLIGRK